MLQHCMDSSLSVKENKAKRSSLIGWLMSDGHQVDNIERSVHNTIQSNNNNFEKIQSLDDKIVLGYNHVTEKLKDMSGKEVLLRDLIVSEQVKNQLACERQQFINVQSQRSISISNIIENSSLHKNISTEMFVIFTYVRLEY